MKKVDRQEQHTLIVNPSGTPSEIKASLDMGAWHLSERSRSFYCTHPCPADPAPIVHREVTRDIFDRYSMDTPFSWLKFRRIMRGKSSPSSV